MSDLIFTVTDDNLSMEDLLSYSPTLVKPELGSVIEGRVVSVRKSRLVIDLNGIQVGLVSGKDTHDTKGTMKDLAEGDLVKAVVIQDEDENGMVVLSLKKASQATAWDRFEKAFKDGEIIGVVITEANKGGLLLDVDGIKGFIPVSQLAPLHYPRVEGADSAKILSRLQKLVGEKLSVKVINVDRTTGKMILSEKAACQADSAQALSGLALGTRVQGRVSGVVKFGIFVTFNGLEGLVHISEIAWGHVSDPHQHAKVGDTIQVEIIGIEGDKLSLSMKRLLPDPWQEIVEKYPVGSVVKGTVNRFSPFGAFVQLPDELNGLIHLSEITDGKVTDPSEFLEIGQEVEATVINIDRDEHRIGLSLKGKGLSKKKKVKKAEESAEPAAEAPVSESTSVAPEATKEEETKPKKAAAKKAKQDADDDGEEKPKKKTAKKSAAKKE